MTSFITCLFPLEMETITFVGKGPENGGLWAAMELSIVPHLLLQGVSVFFGVSSEGLSQFSRLDV